MISKKLAVVAALGALLALGASAAQASVLLPGASNGFTPSALSVSGTFLTSGNLSISATNGTTVTPNEGSLTYAVLKTAGGTLDFLYQLTSTTPPAVDAFNSLTNYTFSQGTQLWATNAGLASFGTTSGTNPFITGTIVPDFVSESNSGNAVAWDFSTSAPQMLNATSDVLVIVTSATLYGNGSSNTVNGGIWTGITPAPVPEPALFSALAGLGLMGGVGLLWRRRR